MAKKKVSEEAAAAAAGAAPAAPAAGDQTAAAPKKGIRPKSTDVQNGIPRPAKGTACGRIWDVCDSISTNSGKPAERGAVLEECRKLGLNDATIMTQHGRWREYHGLVTKRPPAAPKPAEAMTPPAVGVAEPA